MGACWGWLGSGAWAAAPVERNRGAKKKKAANLPFCETLGNPQGQEFRTGTRGVTSPSKMENELHV